MQGIQGERSATISAAGRRDTRNPDAPNGIQILHHDHVIDGMRSIWSKAIKPTLTADPRTPKLMPMHPLLRAITVGVLMSSLVGTGLASRSNSTPAGRFDRLFSQQSVTEITGTIIKVSGPRMILWSSLDAKRYDVFLAPESYLLSSNIHILPGIRAKVKGSLVSGDGQTILIAEFVEVGTRRLVLRDQSGLSRWDPKRSHSLTSVVKNYSGPGPCSMEVRIPKIAEPNPSKD